MGKKLTYGFVKGEFEKEGYVLLSKKYKGAHIKLNYICSKGHRHDITWGNWYTGYRCPTCAGQTSPTIEFVKQKFYDEGYTLLSTIYKNTHTKLDYICPVGHKHKISWDDFKKGYRCFYCFGNPKHSLSYVKDEFHKFGYTLISKVYIGANDKLDYICPVGHKHNITFSSFHNGTRCPICAYIKLSGKNSPHWKGGISCEPYCQDWTKEYKEFIKERDSYKCLNPNCWKKDKVLTVHHIDYNKKNCGPENLITICRSCNSRANTDREWHKAWYQTIMYKRYKYTY